jgi:hypothetical protein
VGEETVMAAKTYKFEVQYRNKSGRVLTEYHVARSDGAVRRDYEGYDIVSVTKVREME